MINASGIVLNQLDILRLCRTTPQIRRNMMANRKYNTCFTKPCSCDKCENISTGTYFKVYLERKAFLSQFFENVHELRRLDIKEGRTWYISCYIQSKMWIENGNTLLIFEKNYGYNIEILQPTQYLKYTDKNWDSRKIISLTIPNPEQVLCLDIASGYSINNYATFTNLVSLKLSTFGPDSTDVVGDFWLECLPLSLETLSVRNKCFIGQFNVGAKLKHLILAGDPTRNYSDAINLPLTVETVVIDRSLQVVCNSNLKCFGRILHGYRDKTDKNFSEITLPNGLEIYVHISGDYDVEDNPFSKVNEKYLLKKKIRYTCYSISNMCSITLPQSLRILAMSFGSMTCQNLPNLETIYTFAGKTARASCFQHVIKTIDAPNLKTMVLDIFDIKDADPIFNLFNTRYTNPICHLILKEEVVRIFCPKVNAKNITCVVSEVAVNTFVNHDFTP
jgi:hypothetical protein